MKHTHTQSPFLKSYNRANENFHILCITKWRCQVLSDLNDDFLSIMRILQLQIHEEKNKEVITKMLRLWICLSEFKPNIKCFYLICLWKIVAYFVRIQRTPETKNTSKIKQMRTRKKNAWGRNDAVCFVLFICLLKLYSFSTTVIVRLQSACPIGSKNVRIKSAVSAKK